MCHHGCHRPHSGGKEKTMTTPICDFVQHYAKQHTLRLHMPGHKGLPLLGMEELDITEIAGADSLYEAQGIIRESEENASRLFGCPTFYSTEGSSQCIRAMIYLAALHAVSQGKRPLIAAGRNAHKTFLSAVAMLDVDVAWITPKNGSYLSCKPSAEEIEDFFKVLSSLPTALYLTSPDYLGNTADIEAIARVCHQHGVLLLVDNAHGAYLRFLPSSMHPMDLGADLCCDSAHKTLPALTGAAYLHLSPNAPAAMREQVKEALALFGSTSPSYLILQSLDATNAYLAKEYPQRLADFLPRMAHCKDQLRAHGYTLCGNEPLKITLQTKSYGYRGEELACALEKQGIVCEFADPDFLVLMLTPEIGEEGLLRLTEALKQIPKYPPIHSQPPVPSIPQQMMTVRKAMLCPHRQIPVEQSFGSILGSPSVGCPPAVPILVCGERIDHAAIQAFSYYGIQTCTVVK
jgi:arginine/lysine/ornithine decarboxylase